MSNKLRNIGDYSAKYTSPSDFTATYTSSTTITLSSLSGFSITDSSQIKYIVQIKSDNTSNFFRNGVYGVTISVSSNVITIYGAGTPFASGDVYQIGIDGSEKGYDSSVGAFLYSQINPDSAKYVDAQELVAASDVGATDDTWKDQGSEISCNGYKSLGIFVNLTVNDSTGNQLQILAKHTSNGSDEYIPMDSGSYQFVLGDSNVKYYKQIDVSSIPHIQMQTKATDVDTGGGTEGTVSVNYTLTY